MGKTVRTITDSYYIEFNRLKPFIRASRNEDRHIIELLQIYTHRHLMAAMSAAPDMPMQIFMLAQKIEQQKELNALGKQLETARDFIPIKTANLGKKDIYQDWSQYH